MLSFFMAKTMYHMRLDWKESKDGLKTQFFTFISYLKTGLDWNNIIRNKS